MVTNIEVKLVKDGIGTSKSDIEKHLKFEHIGFTNAKSHLWSCVDGRSELGTKIFSNLIESIFSYFSKN